MGEFLTTREEVLLLRLTKHDLLVQFGILGQRKHPFVEWPGELQVVERKFFREFETLEKEFVYKDHNPLFYQIIEKKYHS